MMGKVLIIDCDEDYGKVWMEYLRNEGHEVILAKNGEEGIKAFEFDKFDLVITDVAMPERDGIDTLLALKKISPGLPVIVTSDEDSPGASVYLKAARMLGAEYTFLKPFKPLDLLVAVQHLL